VHVQLCVDPDAEGGGEPFVADGLNADLPVFKNERLEGV